MRFLSNAHTHTTYCDGKSTIRETIAAAKALCFVSLGFSSHGDQGFDPAYSMADGRQERYVSELRAFQAEELTANEAPRLWVGVEEDALTPARQKKENRRVLDYVIGSTHYLVKDHHGQPIAVDGDPEALKAYVRTEIDGDGLEMARRYYAIQVASLLETPPAIIGHFDLVRKYALSHSLFDPSGFAYRRIALDALERAFPCGAVLEVNTGAMARGTMDSPYPTLELLGAWKEMGGRATLTSDCHDASKLDFGFEAALRLLAKAGYHSVERLGRDHSLWETERLTLLKA
ncbi:MAG: PHP domain-containing protein [Eubacteriales bacterium]|nr:PHP domain-containing protein [Eubacteriales bacterium]